MVTASRMQNMVYIRKKNTYFVTKMCFRIFFLLLLLGLLASRASAKGPLYLARCDSKTTTMPMSNTLQVKCIRPHGTLIHFGFMLCHVTSLDFMLDEVYACQIMFAHVGSQNS